MVSESSADPPSPTSCRPLLLLPVPDTDGDEPNTRRATDTRRHRARIRWRTRTEEFPSGEAALSRKRGGGGGRTALTSLRRRIIAKLVTEVSASMTSCDKGRHSVAEVTAVDWLRGPPVSTCFWECCSQERTYRDIIKTRVSRPRPDQYIWRLRQDQGCIYQRKKNKTEQMTSTFFK